VLTLYRQRHVHRVAVVVERTDDNTVVRHLGADRRFVDHRSAQQIANLGRELAGGLDQRRISRPQSLRG
jgi:hypothetical protein